MRQVIVYKSQRQDWIAECPSLPGCSCRATSKAEVIDCIREAIDEYIAELEALCVPVPQDEFEMAVVLV